MQEVFEAVKFMHDNGVVHRDLKVQSPVLIFFSLSKCIS